MRTTLRDLRRVLDAVSERKTAQFTRKIIDARRIFVYGVGRSGLLARTSGKAR